MILNGKTAVITGGAQGLGKYFAEALLKEGCRVCLLDIQEEIGQKTLNEFQKKYGSNSVMFACCDVTKKVEIEKTFKAAKERFGSLDIVVNNAGISGSSGDWERMIDINLKGVIHGTYIGFEHMNKNDGGNGGTIINIGSTAGLTIIPFNCEYTASKHGVVSFTRSIAGYYEATQPGHGVSVNTLCPSFTMTTILKSAINEGNEPPQVMKDMGIMRPERVAEAFMKLLSDENRTGAAFAVTPVKMVYRYPGSKL